MHREYSERFLKVGMRTFYAKQSEALPDRVIVSLTGFREGWKRETGIEKLRRGWWSQPMHGVWVMDPIDWDRDMEEVAQLIARNSKGNARILIVAYSWGVAAGVRLVRELEQLGRTAWGIVSCDGVRRPLVWLPIQIPASVRRFWGVYQRVDWPRGYRPTFEGTDTHVIAWEEVPMPHREADESALFLTLAANAVNGLVNSLGMDPEGGK